MAVSDYNDSKYLQVTSVSGTPTVSKAQPIILVDGSLYHNGNGFVRVNFDNISDSQDVAVYDQNDNLLDYEVENLDTSRGYGVLWAYNDWARDDTRGARVAFGNNSANTDRQNVTGTWGNTGQNTYMVQHLEENSSPFLDSTSNNIDSTSTTGTTQVSGQFSDARQFDGTDDGINFSNAGLSHRDFTVVSWINADSFSSNSLLLGQSDISNILHSPDYLVANSFNSNGLSFRGYDGSAGHQVDIPSTDLSTGTYYHVVSAYTAASTNTMEIFLDAVSKDSTSFSADLNMNPSIEFGELYDGGTWPYDGMLDEIRIYTENKKNVTGWIQADYDASPKAGQVFFTQQAAETTTTTDTAGHIRQTKTGAVVETKTGAVQKTN